MMKRRHFLETAALGMASISVPSLFADGSEPFYSGYPIPKQPRLDSDRRVYHLSVGSETVASKPELGEAWKEAGVKHLWLTLFHRGRLSAPRETFERAIRRTFELGMTPHFLSVPLGHPTQPQVGKFPKGWKPALRYDGHQIFGVSCHAPADQACIDSNRFIQEKIGPNEHFIDDDFRCADTPNEIGGCVCPECREAFMKGTGTNDAAWDELIESLKKNDDTPLVRLWVDWQCDLLTDLFRRTEAAAPEVDLGIMVMGMGSERAGIRLEDYRGKLFRVGEWMFSDQQYDPLKNKTIEMFSVLFHRRFTEPGRTFSETTIAPENSLCKENMASKLVFSTFADVRNTMFMCPIPIDYWPFFAKRMKRESAFHEVLRGKTPRGPFKHFWGKAARYLASYNAYSLFLAAGVPFEVCGELPADGWTFLGDNDARSLERGEISSPGTRCIARGASESGKFSQLGETMESLFEFRRPLLPGFQKERIPYIEEETPIVCGWYPEARAVLLWNPERTDKTVHLCLADRKTAVELPALESELLLENGDGTYRCMNV